MQGQNNERIIGSHWFAANKYKLNYQYYSKAQFNKNSHKLMGDPSVSTPSLGAFCQAVEAANLDTNKFAATVATIFTAISTPEGIESMLANIQQTLASYRLAEATESFIDQLLARWPNFSKNIADSISMSAINIAQNAILDTFIIRNSFNSEDEATSANGFLKVYIRHVDKHVYELTTKVQLTYVLDGSKTSANSSYAKEVTASFPLYVVYIYTGINGAKRFLNEV